jgi:hypothetical protein
LGFSCAFFHAAEALSDAPFLYKLEEGFTGYQATSKSATQRKQKAKNLPLMGFELASTRKSEERRKESTQLQRQRRSTDAWHETFSAKNL